MFRSRFLKVKPYVLHSIVEVDVKEPKTFHISRDHDGVEIVLSFLTIPHIHILQLLVLENVAQKAPLLLLVLVIITYHSP